MVGLFSKLKSALTKTSSKISDGIEHIFVKKRLDEKALEDLEDILLMSDVGSSVSGLIIDKIRKKKFEAEITPGRIKEELASIISEELVKQDHSFHLGRSAEGPVVVLVCGVNGNGKTTSIGKLANLYKSQGMKVSVAACDTFRAAAIEQLEIWTDRAGVKLYKGEQRSDPASVAHMALTSCIKEGDDILFIDTAGRLHNQKNLMDELAKITRVISNIMPDAPHHSLLVIDATTGQNAFNQTEQFKNIAGISGLVITKLDGTAKAGAVVVVVDKYKLPVHFIGIGEGIGDLKIFSPHDFASALVGSQG